AATPWIVEDGRPQAEIVIAEQPPRMAKLAASELQLGVKKMTGAELPIVTAPGGELPVKIYVGRSRFTDELGLSDVGLKHGAFRMVSGPDWLALVGNDANFEPVEPWPHSAGDAARAQAEWDKITGATWQNPMFAMYKSYHNEFNLWRHDAAGSLNAVCDFLRGQGMRWYMPGELGEVVPRKISIALPAVDRTVHPSFALRTLKWSMYAAINWDDLIWDLRQGINTGIDLWGASSLKSHGIRAVISRPEMQEAHPEYYALLGGVRDTSKKGSGTPCLRSEGLIEETVAFQRALFDHYNEPMGNVWPTDGFRQCQCDLCKDIDNVSDYVWGFVDRVAREVARTHPDRKIMCGAYTSYAAPPPGIDKFGSNVVVYIANCGRPAFGNPERWQQYWDRVIAWQAKLAPGNLLRGENNLYTGRSLPVAFPALHPREFARDLKALQGIGQGERNESPRGGKQQTWYAPGVDHLNLYVNARFLWDASQDIDAVLDEYYKLFYGPARYAVQAAFEYADDNFPAPPDPKRPGWLPPVEVRARFVEMLQAAREQAGDTVYGRRIQLIMDELPPLDTLRQLAHEDEHAADQREQAPLAVGRDLGGATPPETYRLRNLTTGDDPEIATTFQVGWDRDALVFDFRCEEPDMVNLYATANVWDGDCVALLLETPVYAYYQVEVGPEGAVFDADRNQRLKQGVAWSAQAEVETERGPDFWRVRIRLPLAGEDGHTMDPSNNIAGDKPTAAKPWYFNAGRTRVRQGQKTNYVFSPGGKSFHDRDRFVRLAIEE
ncbi:MAG: DUF4838 domain-containing protein, partial [Lentisphaerae bacterium]|nr:DUF4838 domain-containing protein [Lentisphaerota bacterium]